jgi:DUF4097 and DUF4098 domain-containing protein YvlB
MIRKFVVTFVALGAALGLSLVLAPSAVTAQESAVSKVMGTIDIEPGQHAGDLSTVNGSIRIGADAIVGNAKTVNGSVRLESRAKAAELSTVNGSIDIRDGGHVAGDVHTVNGATHIENDAEVSGSVGTVNGGIRVERAHIVGSINTTNGNIHLGPNAHIDGNVSIDRDRGWHTAEHIPHVVVGPGTVVRGKLRFGREVVLYVSDRASIGPVEGAEVRMFSGDHPPSE